MSYFRVHPFFKTIFVYCHFLPFMANHYGSAGAAAAQLAMHAVQWLMHIPYGHIWVLDRSLTHVLRNGIYAPAQSSRSYTRIRLDTRMV